MKVNVEYEVGDVVVLKSGSWSMTVLAIDETVDVLDLVAYPAPSNGGLAPNAKAVRLSRIPFACVRPVATDRSGFPG